MLFDSIPFVIFFVSVFILYFTLPAAWQKWLLLLASCYFYMAFIPQYILVLFFLITIDYILGLRIERSVGKTRMLYLVFGIATNIGTLFFFKYFNFFNQNVATLADFLHWNYSLESLAIILPIGLSFHTFQSLAYIFEVYKGRFAAERNYVTYALYVMFFPQLVAGPIERPEHLLPQLRNTHTFNYDSAVSGLQLLLWGFFKKIVIANNLAILVDFVYGHLDTANGSMVLLAVFSFAIVLYADFSGYSDIAVGSARMLGIELAQNFRQPYFAESIAELWRRWHISLSLWFRDYVYYPLVWSGKGRGAAWVYLSIITTFLLTGVWHGAGLNFIIMGLIFGLLICLEVWTRSLREKILGFFPIKLDAFYTRSINIVITFVLASFSWVFFRANDLTQAITIIKKVFLDWGPGAFSYLTCTNYCAFYEIGIGKTTLAMIGVSVTILFAYELFTELRLALPAWWYRRTLRWSLYYAFIIWILFAGNFVPKTFIYFQF